MKLRHSLPVFASLIIVLFAIPAVTGEGYITSLMYSTFRLVVLTVAWDFAGGLAGLISLGNAAFFGMGAYAAAISMKSGLDLLPAILIGGVISALLAVVLSVSIKLRGVYFIMATLFLAETVRILMLNWTPVTGGARGIHLPTPEDFSLLPYYYISLVTLVAICSFYYWIRRSWIGYALRAIGSDEEVANSLGVNSVRYKVFALMVGAFFTGTMGGLYASFTLFVEPFAAFNLWQWSLNPSFAAIIGGMGTLWGAVIGGLIMSLILELLIPLGGFRIVVQSVILIVIILFSPTGIYGLLVKIRWRRRTGQSLIRKRQPIGEQITKFFSTLRID